MAALTARALRMSSQRPGVAAAGQVEAAPELGAGILALVGVIHGANCRGMGVMIIRTQKSRRQSRLPKPSEPSPRPSLQVALRAGGGAESYTGKLQRIGGTVTVTTRADSAAVLPWRTWQSLATVT